LSISTLDAAILLYHLTRGAQIKEIGFEDIDHTMEELQDRLSGEILVPVAAVESCLWSANLMNEVGAYWHPTNKSFDEFVANLVGPNKKFHRIYNLITDK
jgi:hypothetical protein